MKALLLALALAPLTGCATLERDLASFSASMAQVDWVAVSQSWADSNARMEARNRDYLRNYAPRNYYIYSLGPGRYQVTGY